MQIRRNEKLNREERKREVVLVMATVGRNIAGPLLFLNLIMYIVVVGFASWCLNKYINFSTRHPGQFDPVSWLAS